MRLVELRTNPSDRELAWFGLLLLAFAGFLGGLGWLAGAFTVSRAVWAVGIALAAVYYAVPRVRRPVWGGWMRAAYPIGWTVSHVLLAMIYYGLLTPIGLLMRLAGYDPMRRALDRTATTYWTERVRTDADDVVRYFRQF